MVGSVSVHGLPVAGGWTVTVLDAHATAPIEHRQRSRPRDKRALEGEAFICGFRSGRVC